MNTTYECKCHPEREPIPAWNYLGGVDYICPECKDKATFVKRDPEHCKYYQHGETGRTCATLNILKGDWYEITKEAYFEINTPTPPPLLDGERSRQ